MPWFQEALTEANPCRAPAASGASLSLRSAKDGPGLLRYLAKPWLAPELQVPFSLAFSPCR